ncbi:uncharacterized protein LOC125939663 [Dermacentor silvarum]|uniref:uncharacterized protein LOC125939663 n=1 Tax=Dermacentor silvarum TaxID=543639 RepID=UPI0021018395|nr:uncharacterized protein LOC125939663 [Dermacentor silvarum]
MRESAPLLATERSNEAEEEMITSTPDAYVMDTTVTVPAGDSKGVFVAFASCALLVVLMLSLSAGGPQPAGRLSLDQQPRTRGHPGPTTLALFCPQARAERPESAGLLFGLSLFPYHLCTHAVFCCAHLNESSLQIEAPSDAQGFPRYLRGLNPHLRPLLGLGGRMPAAMMSGSDWIFLESSIVWLTPRGYAGAVLLWKVSLDTLAARRGYSELLERVSRRFGREGFVLSVLVDTGDSLKQRLDLGELDAALPGGGDHSTASVLLHPIVREPPVARSQGVEDARSAVVYEKHRLRDALKQLRSTLRQARAECCAKPHRSSLKGP